MLRLTVLICVLVAIVAIVLLQKAQRAQVSYSMPKQVEIVRYFDGKAERITPEDPAFADLLAEGKAMFLQSDSTNRLIFSEKRIEDIRTKQSAVEIVFPDVQTGVVFPNRKVHFAKLLIPLSGDFGNGTVFFAGSDATGAEVVDDSFLARYGSTNFVRNSRGIAAINKILGRIRRAKSE
jgi:hypothetical protein